MTDHYARAVKTLQAVLDYAETDENTDALVSIIAAQVHAILALAEQQRVSNDLLREVVRHVTSTNR